MRASALRSNATAAALFPQDARGCRQVQAIERAIRETLAYLNSPAGKRLVRAAPEAAKVSGSEVVAIAPDLHFHWADPACVSLFLLAIALSRPGRIVLLGDVLEAGAFSSHKRKTITEESGGYIDAEVYTALLFMDALQALAPDALLVMLGGNHEARVEASAATLPGGLGRAMVAGCDPYTLLARRVDGTQRARFIAIPYQKALSHYKITPDLWAIHGWFCGVNFCMDTLRKSQPVSMVMGHAHRQQSVALRNPVDNTVRRAWSPGTLSLLQPLWNAPNPTDWVQGFSFVYVGANQLHWSEYTITIMQHACVLPGGTQISAIGCDPPRSPNDAWSTPMPLEAPVPAGNRAKAKLKKVAPRGRVSSKKADAPKKSSLDYISALKAAAAIRKARAQGKPAPKWATKVDSAIRAKNKARRQTERQVGAPGGRAR